MGRIANQLLALNSAKHAIREAINEKGGTLGKGDPLSAYPAAINGIIDKNAFHVIFIDWDGTVLQDEWISEGAPAVVPATPQHEYLDFLRWTKPAADLNEVHRDMVVGAVYTPKTTANGEVAFFIEGEFYATQYNVKFVISRISGSGNYSLLIDWGDGNTQTVSANNDRTITHTYDSAVQRYKIVAYNTATSKACLYSMEYSYAYNRIFNCLSETRFNTTYFNGLQVIAIGTADGITQGYSFSQNSQLSLKGVVDSNGTVSPSARALIFPNSGPTLLAVVDGQEYSLVTNSTVQCLIFDVKMGTASWQNKSYAHRVNLVENKIPAFAAIDTLDIRGQQQRGLGVSMSGAPCFHIRFDGEIAFTISTFYINVMWDNYWDFARALVVPTEAQTIGIYGGINGAKNYGRELAEYLQNKGYTVSVY